ncbi:MAG TPA: nucleotidyltransferase family protein [Bacteroidia bacterium]|jgi:D-glycero-alpha-D-manno-heptose 1-phosphate guanylyltransferase|nr:nucleotidyltransferase family protein [Bacteroidia bacterium]
MEAIVLAGGMGTRLQSVVKDVPKPMAAIKDKPFLYHVLTHLQRFSIEKIILSVGYKSEVIQSYFGNQFKGTPIEYAIEQEPLGTGGAIFMALQKINTEHVFITNGDTFFNVDITAFKKFHLTEVADVSMCLRSLPDISRYGTVRINETHQIIGFEEKQGLHQPGTINAGSYIFNAKKMRALPHPQKFSIEKDFFEKNLKTLYFAGFVTNDYFIDIGIPEDYARAQKELEDITTR